MPKNGDRSFDLDSIQPHESYLNYGTHCEVCGLPKNSVISINESKDERPLGVPIALAIGALVTLSVLTIGYLIRPQNCPYGQKQVNGNCVALNSKGDLSLPSSQTQSSEQKPTSNSFSLSPVSTFAAVPNVPAMKARYGGSISFAPLRTDEIVQRIATAQPGYELTYIEPLGGQKPGSGAGIQMLLEGQLSFAQSSRPLQDKEYNAAKNRGFLLEQEAVAIDGIAIFVNSQLPIPKLTVSQLKAIYMGKITNWKQLGGFDLKITPFSQDPRAGGTAAYFQESILDRQPFATSVQTDLRDNTSLLRQVASTAGGIGYATASEVCHQGTIKILAIAKEAKQNFVTPCDGKQVDRVVIANDSYPITRRLFVILKKDGALDEQAGVAYVNLLLSEEGQQIIEQAGFVRIR
jgi:phosphate transport system substrate-binding protein